jgi:radical SAM protein (TIGR01212 family)
MICILNESREELFMQKIVEKGPVSKQLLFPWGTSRRYNAYVDYLKSRFGNRIQKVIVNAGFTCPNRDGTKGYGGCIYCNNDSFKPPYCEPEMSISEQVEAGISFLSRRYKVDRFMVYFQPYTNTYAPLDTLREWYEQALSHPQVIGLSIGTRPDCVDIAKIEYLEHLAKSYYINIEYGLESPYDHTLEWINRQHTFQTWVDAVKMTAGRRIEICSHIILGLPTESRQEMIQTANIISRYPIDALKIHHLHVVQKTVLAQKYRENPFPLLELSNYTEMVVDFLQCLRPEIKIQRLVGETQPRLLIGPQWHLRADVIQRRIERDLAEQDVWQGKLWNTGKSC